MGSGKGNPEGWVAVVKPGKVMFELAGVSEDLAREALRLAGHKPIKTKFVARRALAVKASDVHALGDQDLVQRSRRRARRRSTCASATPPASRTPPG